MIKDENKYELIKFEDGEFSLDVNVSPDEETVWLTQKDMSLLFNVDLSRISRHIKNIFDDMELDEKSNLRKTQFPFSDKLVILYSLDVTLAVGYRVKSKRGIQFRKWANSILKQYLLNGHAINEERCLACNSNIVSLQSKMNSIESKIKEMEETIYLNSKAFYEGEIVDPYVFLRHIFFLAKNEITITDFYADKYLLSMLKDIKVKITIITSTSSYLNKEILPNNINIISNDFIHGRYIFIDNKLAYVIDTSFNNIGKKRFMIIRLENITKDKILKEI